MIEALRRLVREIEGLVEMEERVLSGKSLANLDEVSYRSGYRDALGWVLWGIEEVLDGEE